MTTATPTRAHAAELDAADPLARFRDRFDLPDGLVYLDGNSLGALPKGVTARVTELIEREWGRDLIRSWNVNGWMELSSRIGDKIASLIGADAGEVVCADSTSVNLFKVLAAAVKLNAPRRVVISQRDNFPTDLYIAQGLLDLLGDHELRLVDEREVADAIGDDTAVVMLTHVNYRTGSMHDMAAITRRAHERGALMLWDLSHSTGAVPVDLNGAGADFAIGCGYKYLNGGPGAPAFLWVPKRHQPRFSQPLSGWLGHARPFAFVWNYEPADGIGRYLCGTPNVLSMAALECGVDVMREADMSQLRAKSLALSDLFIECVESRCAGHGLSLVTPREHAARGSQACFAHPEGYPIMQALIARNVIGDFRAPDILRFGFTPLYTRFVDVWDAVETLRDVLDTRAWDTPEFKSRKAVT